MDSNRLETEARELADDFSEKIVDALVFVAGFAWADALRSMFEDKGILHGAKKYGPWFVAVVITLLAIFSARIFGKNKEPNGKKCT